METMSLSDAIAMAKRHSWIPTWDETKPVPMLEPTGTATYHGLNPAGVVCMSGYESSILFDTESKTVADTLTDEQRSALDDSHPYHTTLTRDQPVVEVRVVSVTGDVVHAYTERAMRMIILRGQDLT